jgi:hypothetical protein
VNAIVSTLNTHVAVKFVGIAIQLQKSTMTCSFPGEIICSCNKEETLILDEHDETVATI